MKNKLLLTTTTAPSHRIESWAATDQMAYRLTRGQGPFTLYQHTHASGLHLLAQNLSCPSTVLENPSEEDFNTELSREYEFVAISFDPFNAESMVAMCGQIRRQSPRSRIIVGGYGAICLAELSSQNPLERLIDGVCQGEGIAYMRSLLNEQSSHPITSLLPKEGATLPWLNPRSVGTNGIILSGLGCRQRCSFCATSAYTSGRYVEVMNAADIFEAMQAYWTHSAFTASVSIYDENFLDQKSKVDSLGKLIRNDRNFGLSRLNFSAFGSISALAKYEPEELLLAGLDKVWCGVESKFSGLAKRRGPEPTEVFSNLHAAGIKTIGSWIIGQEFQHPGNIREDMDYFLSLDSCFQQLSILGVVPGTPLWQQYSGQGRIPGRVPWSEYHLYGKTFNHDRFTHRQMLDHLDDFYDRIYRVNGPALMKSLEVNLNGYQTCLGSRSLALRTEKARFFKDQCRSYYPLVKTALEFAPSPAVRSRIETIDRRYSDLLGVPSKQEMVFSDQILERAQRIQAEDRGQDRLREEPHRRYTYPPQEARPSGKPYRVEYPTARSEVRFERDSTSPQASEASYQNS